MVIGCTSGIQLTLICKEQERGYSRHDWSTQLNLTYITDPMFAAVERTLWTSNAPRKCMCSSSTHYLKQLYTFLFQFWYCRNPGLALPLIALQYHEVKINLDIRPIDECLWAVSSLDCEEKVNPGTSSQDW